MSLIVDSFVFGTANSLHCACMCGPLALAHGGRNTANAAYHGGRAAAYTAVGGALGGTGSWFGSYAIGSRTAIVAFVLAAGLVVLATIGERGALRIPGLGSLAQKATGAGRRLPPVWRATLLGVVTPLLPCGLLWSSCAAAAVAGSAVDGGTVMLGFAIGSMPLLWFAQWRAKAFAARFSPRVLAIAQRVAMLVAAAILVWRGIAAGDGGCCH